MAFVADNSVILAWFITSQATPHTERFLNRAAAERIHVPGLWAVEFVNALAVLEAIKKLTPAQSAAMIDHVNRFDIQTHQERGHEPAILSVARRYGLSAYDAAYFELASRLGLQLATRDGKLKKAAKAAGLLL